MLISKANIQENDLILEPSAGKGNIVDHLLQILPLLQVDCIELNKENCNVLREKGYNTFHQDFLSFTPIKQYDKVIACPPFKKNIDLLHIQKMYSLLKEGGVVVSLTSPLWIINNEPHQVEFRKWLEDKEYNIQILPDNSFIEDYKSVPTAIIQIFKKVY